MYCQRTDRSSFIIKFFDKEARPVKNQSIKVFPYFPRKKNLINLKSHSLDIKLLNRKQEKWR